MTTDIQKVAKAIGMPFTHWSGQCYAVALSCINNKVVKGKVRYGHWIGPIHPNSLFARNIKVGFAKHGWVELPNGMVWDPTRWVFECAKPYIYVGVNDFYDIGGNSFLEQNLRPPPKYDPAERQIPIRFDLKTVQYVMALLEDGREIGALEISFTTSQVFWLANLPLKLLSVFAKDIYLALNEVGCKALIPIDNWDYIMN